MKTWLTADWHLGETRFNLMMRPFKHATEQVEKFVSIHNALVAPNDRVIVIGDAVNQNAPNFLPYINFFNGIKTLIRGNHDRPFSDDDLAPYFEHIVKEDEGMEFDFGGIPCYLIHYPTCARADRFNLVGHVHGAWKFQLNALNVGVDTNHFAPYNAEEIPFIFEAINKHYDEDVWAAYHPSNAQHVGVRGKKGRYFK
jgi:calcineurin-like phosphoesterase family protein